MKNPTRKQLKDARAVLTHLGLSQLTFGFVLNWIDGRKATAVRDRNKLPREFQIIVGLATTAIIQLAEKHKAAATSVFAISQHLATLYAAEIAKPKPKRNRKAA